jgi:hypothetical protein
MSEAGVLSVSLKMDKTEYRAVIKYFVKEGLTPNEIHSKFIKVYGTLLRHLQQLRNGLPSLNVAVPALKMIRVKDVQKVQEHQLCLLVLLLETESSRTVRRWVRLAYFHTKYRAQLPSVM